VRLFALIRDPCHTVLDVVWRKDKKLEQDSSRELVMEVKDKEWWYRDTEERNKAMQFGMTSSSLHVTRVLSFFP